MVVYVTEQGAEIGKRRGRLEIRKAGRKLDSVRLAELEKLVICGNVQITVQAIRALLVQGVETQFLTRGGRSLGRLQGRRSGNVAPRHAQFGALCSAESGVGVDLSRRLILAKIHNQRRLVLRYQRRRPDEGVARALVLLRALGEDVVLAQQVDRLRGLEGAAAAAYFGVFGHLARASGLPWSGRRRRPPPDPLNILLSFGYTLLAHRVEGHVEAAGLDPYLGALHASRPGRPSLVCDLMEPWRPVLVDALVLSVVNRKVIRDEHFVPGAVLPPGAEPDPSARPLVLLPEASKRWFTAFERRMAETVVYHPEGRRLSFGQVLQQEVRACARYLQGQEPDWQPFRLAQ